ncbi:MAG TPA: acetylxylan esterase [bacterium]|nr:acetylxylan esterase [bacterium]
MRRLYALMLLFAASAFSSSGEDLILRNWLAYTDADNALYHALCLEAFHHLDVRQERVRNIHDGASWQAFRDEIRAKLNRAVGSLPAKTPLKPKVAGRLQQDGYSIEKILFQSQPDFYVTACLFLPEKKGKHPAVVYCSGHSNEGFRLPVYLLPILNLVKKGFVVLAFDPAGQGERLQYYDPQTGKSAVGGPTREHSYAGAQCFLAGYSPAVYWIWDGIRAVDYLVSRPEVDAKRIGITGRSGGGTQSAYIAAFDERIRAAAPECYITSFRRLLQSVGPQDAEQHFYHGISQGIDMADLLLARAPRPALIIATTRDYFSVQGARETFAEVSRIYRMLDAGALLQMTEDDSVHASTKKNREAMYAFFQKQLDQPGSAAELEVTLPDLKTLQVTTTGQVAGLEKTETHHSLNKRRVQLKIEQLVKSRAGDGHLNRVLERAKTLSGYRPAADSGTLLFAGRQRKEGWVWENYLLPLEHTALPFIKVYADQGPVPDRSVVFLHPQGKAALWEEEKNWQPFARNGYAVIWPDLSEIGELGGGALKGDSYDFLQGKGAYNMWFLSIQVARSLVALRAQELNALVRQLKKPLDPQGRSVSAVAFAESAPVLLHAAVFDSAIERSALIGSFVSYEDLAGRLFYKPEYISNSVAGCLGEYDLQDLAALMAPRPLAWFNGCNANGQALTREQCEQAWSYARQAYNARGASDRLLIQVSAESTPGEILAGLW